jgi:RNA polymerase sigma factor (sigma-70 family)
MSGDGLPGRPTDDEIMVRLASGHADAFGTLYTPPRTGRESQFTTWLFTIARNLAIDDRRAQRPAVDTDGDVGPGPDATHERRHDIERALATLPAAQREVVLLGRVAGLEASEIAAVVNSTPGAVRVTLHRALRQLRTTLDGDRG